MFVLIGLIDQAPVRLRDNANDLATIPPLSVPSMLKNQVELSKVHYRRNLQKDIFKTNDSDPVRQCL